MAQRRSFFEEKRVQRVGPEYFNRPEATEEISNNVVRIIRDVHYNNIHEQDYVYFKNPNIAHICLQTALKNSAESLTMYHALDLYRCKFLSAGIYPYPDCDPQLEAVNSNNLAAKYYNSYITWKHFAKMFEDIRNGADAYTALAYVRNYDRRLINGL